MRGLRGGSRGTVQSRHRKTLPTRRCSLSQQLMLSRKETLHWKKRTMIGRLHTKPRRRRERPTKNTPHRRLCLAMVLPCTQPRARSPPDKHQPLHCPGKHPPPHRSNHHYPSDRSLLSTSIPPLPHLHPSPTRPVQPTAPTRRLRPGSPQRRSKRRIGSGPRSIWCL